MQEYVSEALVLAKDDSGELDQRITLFTKRYGKLALRAKSSRKITSKLSAHLEPGNLVQARFVEKRGLQVVDALKGGRAAAAPPDLHFLGQILPEGEPDFPVWQALTAREFSWRRVLALLGWDPHHAACDACAGKPEAFHVRSQRFYCPACASRFRRNEVLFYT